MATVGNAFNVNAAVSGTATGTSGTLYTAPATGYAIVNVWASTGGAATITVGGRTVITGLNGAHANPVYVGPSQALAFTAGSSNTINVSGVEFANS